jgi:hypothetical protein
MMRQECDFCSEAWPRHKIKMTRTPNGDVETLDLCDTCLVDVQNYLRELVK